MIKKMKALFQWWSDNGDFFILTTMFGGGFLIHIIQAIIDPSMECSWAILYLFMYFIVFLVFFALYFILYPILYLLGIID